MRMVRQDGSLYSLAFNGLVLGVAVLVGLRVFPIYMNELSVRSAVSGVALDPAAAVAQPSVSALRNLLQRRWDVDDIKNLDVGDIKFVKTKAGRIMRYEYSVETPLAYNWGLVLHFKNEYPLGGDS